MPGTPSPLKLGFQRNSYIRVSCDNDHQNSTLEVEQTTQLITDPDPVTEKESDPPPSAVAPGVSYINEGEDDQMEVYGYSKSVSKTIFTWVCIVATAGILRLVFHWYPHWFLQATHSRCHLSVSDRVLLVEQYQKKHKCYFVKTVSIITAQDLFNSDSESWDGQSLNDVEGDRSSVKGRLSIHISGGHFKDMSGSWSGHGNQCDVKVFLHELLMDIHPDYGRRSLKVIELTYYYIWPTHIVEQYYICVHSAC